MTGAVVVGAGIGGIACARALADAGVPVRVLDRGRRPGGRMASRTLRDTGTPWDGRVVDIGASYLTAASPEFSAVVGRLVDSEVLRPWASGFHIAGPDGLTGVSGGPMRYAAPAGLRSVVEALAEGIAVESAREVSAVVLDGTGAALVDAERADAVALCMPTPQAGRLLAGLPDDGPVWEPVLAVTCAFAERSWPELDGVFVNDDAVLTWIADDGSRRGDGAPVLVAHVHPVLSARHLDDPASVIPAAVAGLQRVLGMTAYPDWVDVQRWTYAKPLTGSDEPFWLHPSGTVGLAGDAWSGGPRVEAAWLSGHRLGSALAARVAGSADR